MVDHDRIRQIDSEIDALTHEREELLRAIRITQAHGDKIPTFDQYREEMTPCEDGVIGAWMRTEDVCAFIDALERRIKKKR